MSGRQYLPNRRELEAFTFDHEGVRCEASVGRFPDGSISEIFINAGKLGSGVHTMARDAAVVFSIARQCGVPFGVLFAAMAKLEDCSPAGPLGVALKIAGDS